MKIKARYENKVLKPLEDLKLKEGEIVEVEIKRQSMRDFYGKLEIEKETAEEIIEMEVWD